MISKKTVVEVVEDLDVCAKCCNEFTLNEILDKLK